MVIYRPSLKSMDKDTIVFVRKHRVALAYQMDYFEKAMPVVMKELMGCPPIDILYKAGDNLDSWVRYRQALESGKWLGYTKPRDACGWAYNTGNCLVSSVPGLHIPEAKYVDSAGWKHNIAMDDGNVNFVLKKKFNAGDDTKDIALTQHSIANPGYTFEQRHLMDDLKLTFKNGETPLDSLITFNCLFTPVAFDAFEPNVGIIRNALRQTTYNRNDFFTNKKEFPLLARIDIDEVYSGEPVAPVGTANLKNYYFFSVNGKLYRLGTDGQTARSTDLADPRFVASAPIYYVSESHISGGRDDVTVQNDIPPVAPIVLPIPGNEGGKLIAFDLREDLGTNDIELKRYSVSSDDGDSWLQYPLSQIAAGITWIKPVPYLYSGRFVVEASDGLFYSTQNGVSWIVFTARESVDPYIRTMDPLPSSEIAPDLPTYIDEIYGKWHAGSIEGFNDVFVGWSNLPENRLIFVRNQNNVEVFDKDSDVKEFILKDFVRRYEGNDYWINNPTDVTFNKPGDKTTFCFAWDRGARRLMVLYSFNVSLNSVTIRESGEYAIESRYNDTVVPSRHDLTIVSRNSTTDIYDDLVAAKMATEGYTTPEEEALVRENLAGAFYVNIVPSQVYWYENRWIIRDTAQNLNSNGVTQFRVSLHGKEWFPIRGTCKGGYTDEPVKGQILVTHGGTHVAFAETGEHLYVYTVPQRPRFHYDLRVKCYKWEGIKATQGIRATYVADAQDFHHPSSAETPMKIGFPIKINPNAFMLFYNGMPILGDKAYVNPVNHKEIMVEGIERYKTLQAYVNPIQFIINKREWIYSDFRVVNFTSEDDTKECFLHLDLGRIQYSYRELAVDFGSDVLGECILLNGVDHEYLITQRNKIRYPVSRFGLHEAVYAGHELGYIGKYNMRTDMLVEVNKLQFVLVDKTI